MVGFECCEQFTRRVSVPQHLWSSVGDWREERVAELQPVRDGDGLPDDAQAGTDQELWWFRRPFRFHSATVIQSDDFEFCRVPSLEFLCLRLADVDASF